MTDENFAPDRKQAVELRQWQVELLLRNMDNNSATIRKLTDTVRWLMVVIAIFSVTVVGIVAMVVSFLDAHNTLSQFSDDLHGIRSEVHQQTVEMQKANNR